jgi:DNA mismatch endonuclease, patch repair protein
MKHKVLNTSPEVSLRMSKIKTKKTKAEILLSKRLWAEGIRYRLNYKKLPGSPDIAISKVKIAIFVDGEFWHGKDWAAKKTKIKNNSEYWIEKIEENIVRDHRNNEKLIELGWLPIHFWERDILKSLDDCIKMILEIIKDRQN